VLSQGRHANHVRKVARNESVHHVQELEAGHGGKGLGNRRIVGVSVKVGKDKAVEALEVLFRETTADEGEGAIEFLDVGGEASQGSREGGVLEKQELETRSQFRPPRIVTIVGKKHVVKQIDSQQRSGTSGACSVRS